MKNNIKRFKEINEFFETTGFEKRTDIGDFFVFRFDELPKENALKIPANQKGFYQVSLIVNSGNAIADINEQTNKTLVNTLYFLSPDHIFSWQRNRQTTGFIVYFKTEFLNFFSGNFKREFSFFSLSEQIFLKLEDDEAKELATDFEPTHFIRFFKKQTLLTRKEYRILN